MRRRSHTLLVVAVGAGLLLHLATTAPNQAGAQLATDPGEATPDLDAVRSSPGDLTEYVRPLVAEDYAPRGALALGAETQGADSSGAGTAAGAPGIFVVDVVVNNTDPNLTTTDTANDGETSIAVNPANPDEIVVTAFSGGWGTGNAPIYHTLDGGLTWTRQLSVPVPPGWPVACPCDWTWDYGRSNRLSASILGISPTTSPIPCGGDMQPSCTFDVVSGTTTNPAQVASWNYFDPLGPPVQAQETNINVPASLGNADQPWLLVNPDPFTPAQDNVYVAWDDFNNTDGNDGPDMRVAVSYGLNPPNFTVDQQVGNSLGSVNPGLRLAEDPRTGFVWALWGRHVGGGDDDSKSINYMLNRSTDGGASWSLNGSAFGIVVATADSTQPRPKFGTVNALLGGVHHAAVDPTTGDLYYVYGDRDAATNNDRLAIRRVSSDGAGGVIIGPRTFVTGQVEAAIPVVAVTENGTIGVFYYTFDGFSSDDFPIFTAHLALSEDQGGTFTDHELLTFLSSAQDDGEAGSRQRVLGDYMQMQAVDNCFYGSFTGNGAPFGRPVANHDPIFFKTCVGPQIQVPGSVEFANTCVGDTSTEALDVCSTGTENLVVQSVASSDAQFAVTPPSAGFPVTVSPDFCFPFEAAFAPSSEGFHSAMLSVNSDDPANPSVGVFATGTGIEPDIAAVIANSGSFGDVCIGAFRDLGLTIANNGGCALTVTSISSDSAEFLAPGVMSPPLVIAPGDSLEVPIRMQPASLGAKNATITISSDDPDTPAKSVDVSGNVPPGDIRVTGNTAFGDVCAEDPTEKTVSVCNVGPCNLQVNSASVDCPDFTLINNPFPAAVSPDSCLDLVVAFTPTSGGPKSCTLTINSDDPDTPVTTLDLTANTPLASIDVPPDRGFRPVVVQSVDVCQSAQPFPVSNTGRCDLSITDLSITANATEYSLSGLPSFPIILEPGHVAGSGDLATVFAPQTVERERQGTVSVTYVSDPITGATATTDRALCGEGVYTGARVLVTSNGTPLDSVKSIRLHRINANRNDKNRLDTVDNARNVALQSVTPGAPCAPFLYHREYGTVSNPVQLLPGSYQVSVQARIGGKIEKRSVGFDVDSCGFNPTIVVDF